MPMELNYNSISKRFDFGVPLEDIFAQEDLHPRLKFIFQQAFELYVESHSTIEDILNVQGYLQDCLDLKESVIYDRQPGLQKHENAGAYFWVIRHFLGLLPIPLLPSTTSTRNYPWQELSRKCRNLLLKSSYQSPEQIDFLNRSISRSLNNLPREHILMLSTIVAFIKEVSKKKLCRETLKSLTRYYCDAIFLRPFMPGRQTDDKMLPLLIYLVSKWHQMAKYLSTCCIPTFTIANSYIGYRLEAEKCNTINSSTQTNQFTTNIFCTNKTEPYRSVNCKFLKDAGSQTDFNCSNSKQEVPTENINLLDIKSGSSFNDNSTSTVHQKEASTAKTDIVLENLSDISKDRDQFSVKTFGSPFKLPKMTSFVSSLVDINEDEEKLKRNEFVECEEEYFPCRTDTENFEETKYHSIYDDYVFNSTVSNDTNIKWHDVVAEIERTVQRVENYNYEDELYVSALREYRSSSSSIDSIVSSTTYDSEFISSFDTPESNSTPKENIRPNKENKKHNKNLKTSYYRSFCNSDEELYCLKDIDEDWQDNGSSSSYSVKRLRLSFNLLKSLSPRLKKSGKVLKSIARRNIKYRKFTSSSNT